MQGPLWAWPRVSTSMTTSARQRVSWGQGRKVRGRPRASGKTDQKKEVGNLEKLGRGDPTGWGGQRRFPLSPPPWRVWAPGEPRRLWREETGTVGVLIPTPQNLSPPATSATCAVPMCKLRCPSTARSQGYCPATEPLCGLWTHQPPAAGPTAAAALWRWVPGAAWWESGPGTSLLSGQPVPEPYNPGAVAPAGGGNDIIPSPA